MFENKKILVTGGTGSLGKVLIRRLLSGEAGTPRKVIVFSRDEAKQWAMRVDYKQAKAPTEDIIYRNWEDILEFHIGDVRDIHSVAASLRDVDIVFNAAALKQVPTCEYFPYQAVMTNIAGPENIVQTIQTYRLPVETVVGISTDKACKPVNVMGMTKAIQERVFIEANLRCPETRFICVRYGNVLASRGSVIPLFHEQIRKGGPLTITTTDMTRFLLSLDQAVDTIFAAVKEAKRGETYIPQVPAAKVADIASVLIGNRSIETRVTGIRPGEKVHEIMVSEEERFHTVDRGNYYDILPVLPEIRAELEETHVLKEEYSSANNVMDKESLKILLHQHKLLIEDVPDNFEELLR